MPVAEKTEQYWRTARHATASFLALVVVMAVIYSESQSSKYTASYVGFQRALLFDEAKRVSSFAELWKWFDKMTNSIASDTLSQINANCGYDSPNSQEVSIEGKTYTLYDPRYQYGPCSNFMFINDPSSAVYLSDTGNHELKTLGIFSGRSESTKSRDQSKLVQNNELSHWDPIKDERVLEICQAPWGEQCVLKDGYRQSMISTLNWNGEKINGVYAYDPSSRTFLIEPGDFNPKVDAEMKEFSPCFHNISGELAASKIGYIIEQENPTKNFTDCHRVWVTPGYEIRKSCLDSLVTQAPAKFSFVLSTRNYSSLIELRNAAYGCDIVLGLDNIQLKNTFFMDEEFLEYGLDGNFMYGIFLNTASQGAWIDDSTMKYDRLSFSKLLDRHTRLFNVMAVTKNDGEDDLFYSMITFSFQMLIDGKILVRNEAIYLPIVAYMYGLDGHPWKFREVLVFESMFLLFLFLFILRECHQDYHHISQFAKDAYTRVVAASVISPDDKDKPPQGEGGADDNDLEENSNCGELKDENLTPVESKGIPTSESLQDFSFIPDEATVYDILDWLTILIGVIMVVYRYKYVAECYNACNALQDLERILPSSPDVSVQDRREQNFASTVSQFSVIKDYEISLYIISMAMLLVCVTQFFRYLQFDARFGIVTRTLNQSLWVLLPVLVVFITVLSTYAVMGTALYGKSLAEWSTFYNSIGALFLLILGEFEGYSRMRHVSSSLTGLFFWSFVVFVILVLFNMVLAIILTVYDETYKKISEDSRSAAMDKKEI